MAVAGKSPAIIAPTAGLSPQTETPAKSNGRACYGGVIDKSERRNNDTTRVDKSVPEAV